MYVLDTDHIGILQRKRGPDRNQRVRIATMDLRIASIAIAQRMTLVTRNQRDFERVPNLELDDWTS